jgi:hypothetical protein
MKRSSRTSWAIFLSILTVAYVWGYVTGEHEFEEEKQNPYVRLRPPYSFSVEKKGENTIFMFRGQKPPLKISHGNIWPNSANPILESAGLGKVATEGRNVEQAYLSGERVGAGRAYRTHYRWEDYPNGPLTFVREKYGCKWQSERYDCLRAIVVGPTDIDKHKKTDCPPFLKTLKNAKHLCR